MSLFERAKSIERGVEVISDWLGDGGVSVDEKLAVQRAAVCARCPQNKDASRLVESVANAIRKHVEVKNDLGLRVPGEDALGECGICLCCLKLKVWVPIDVIRRHMLDGEEKQFLEANAECWQVNE